MPVMNVAKFERFFRLAASLDVDKGDLRRYNDFLDQKIYDLDEQIELAPILEGLTKHPPMDLDYNDQTKAELPQIAGGMSVALARSFRVLVPGLKNPAYPDWDRAFQAFNLLL